MGSLQAEKAVYMILGCQHQLRLSDCYTHSVPGKVGLLLVLYCLPKIDNTDYNLHSPKVKSH